MKPNTSGQEKVQQKPSQMTHISQGQNHAAGPSGSNNVQKNWRNQGTSSNVPAGGPRKTQADKAEARLHDTCPVCNKRIRHTPRNCPTFQGLSDSDRIQYFYGEKPVCRVCLGDAYPHVIGDCPNFKPDGRYTRERG